MKPQRILVCGGRNYSDKERLFQTMDYLASHYHVECVISGMARGADMLGAEWAEIEGIPVLKFPAQWGIFGRGAGFVRNQKMLDDGEPTLVVAFPGGSGTRDMVGRAQAANINVLIIADPLQ
jgi:hypothetical protein